jgi:hypothetical protein
LLLFVLHSYLQGNQGKNIDRKLRCILRHLGHMRPHWVQHFTLNMIGLICTFRFE